MNKQPVRKLVASVAIVAGLMLGTGGVANASPLPAQCSIAPAPGNTVSANNPSYRVVITCGSYSATTDQGTLSDEGISNPVAPQAHPLPRRHHRH